jgi:type I restriction enzyme R subunit
VVQSGIADAINQLPDGIKSDRTAVAETIENNVRSKIIKDHLNDPAYFETMSALLDEIIAARKAKAIDYEAYLKKIAELAVKVQAGQGGNTPMQLNTPGRRALYNNLQKLLPQSPTVGVWQQPASVGNVPYDHALELAMRVDAAIKTNRPDGWRGVLAREQIIRRAIFDAVQNFDFVEPIFLIIVQQGEY